MHGQAELLLLHKARYFEFELHDAAASTTDDRISTAVRNCMVRQCVCQPVRRLLRRVET